jgi:uncharacterized protein YcfJ
MKQTLLFTALGLLAFGAAAQEVGQVISSTPVIQQVAVPRQVCSQGAVMPAQTSGGGGLLGALAGGAIGSAVGAGAGHAAAIVGGTVLGAIVGNNVEANNQRYVQAPPNCVTENTYENRTVAYNVTYEYAGRQYTTQMPYDPGRTLQLQVSPMGGGNVAQGGIVTAPPVQGVATVVAPAPVVVQAYPAYPAYPAYYPYYRPYPPVGVSLGFVFGGGHRHHWR